MSGKKCPNCGRCEECGHVPNQFRPWPYVWPYWSVQPPYTVPDTTFPPYRATWQTTGGNYSGSSAANASGTWH